MLTLLPYADYEQSAKILNNELLEEQIKAVNIILDVLHQVNESSDWNNSPAIQMWLGYEPQLCMFGLALCEVYETRNGRGHEQEDRIQWHLNCATGGSFTMRKPPWSGLTLLHESHQAELIRRHRKYVMHFGVSTDIPIYWPEMKPDGTLQQG